MQHQPARSITKWIGILFFGMVVTIGFLYGALDALEREYQMQDEIRKERCARFGENLPKELEGYCDERKDQWRN